ncbi:hypothetical protein WJ970_23705 [Achromobacter xylosoxidans]
MDAVRGLPGDGDLVYLHYLNDETLASIRPAFNPERDTPVRRAGALSVYEAWSCGGASCYLVTQRGARKLLEHLRGMRYPSDGLLARLTASGQLRAYALWPRRWPSTPSSQPSDDDPGRPGGPRGQRCAVATIARARRPPRWAPRPPT